jgi:hypothetical protein
LFIFTGGLISLIVYWLEFTTYDNFVYSHFHILPDHLAIFAGFLIGLFILSRMIKQSFLIMLSLMVVVSFGFSGISRATAAAAANLSLWLFSPQSIADRAVSNIYGNDLKFIEFIKNSTPDNSRIVIPPAAAGRRHTADIWLMSSFLYPRKITDYRPEMDLSKYDYVVISSEFDTEQTQGNTWPDFDIKNARVVIYDWDNDRGVQIPELGYNSKIISAAPSWGLITILK